MHNLLVSGVFPNLDGVCVQMNIGHQTPLQFVDRPSHRIPYDWSIGALGAKIRSPS